MSKLKTLEDFKEELYNVWGDKYIVSPDALYVNAHTKIKLICSRHGEFEAEPNSVLHKHGCKECRRETIGKERRLTQDEVIKRLTDVWGDKYDLSKVKYVNARTKITPICKKHGPFEIRFSDFENFHGCKLCNESILENELDRFLKDNGLRFEREYKDVWLKNGVGYLKIDFYLPEFNTAIECQGKQHYTDKSKYCSNNEFLKIKERDERKFNLCKENNVKLLYYTNYKGEIPEMYRKYTSFDKDELLNEIKKGTNL